MVDAIVQEAILRKDEISETIDTIYFGGGTPSLCKMEEVRCMIEALRKLYNIHPAAEITFEANPDDITEEKLIGWKANGINRLSIGIQSFFADELQWMNRAHNADEAVKSLALATTYFKNISIDLIYGTSLLTDEQWLHNLNTAASYNITHLSCYALTVEEGTALHQFIKQEKIKNTDADKQAHHFEMLMQWAVENGYEHYEISNLAKPNYRSQHNSSYWKGKPYLGLGPSAHSFNGKERQWNIANNALYIKSIEQQIVPLEKEILTPVQQLNEYIMTGLRRIEGIDLLLIENKWGADFKNKVIHSAKKWISSLHLLQTENILQLTDAGKFLADGIAADLFC